jgi:hypothetical protein
MNSLQMFSTALYVLFTLSIFFFADNSFLVWYKFH